MHVTHNVQNWIANPYVVETSEFEEEDEEGNNVDDVDDEEYEFDANRGEASVQRMTNSPPRMNQHIRFSSTSTSSTTPSAEDIVQHRSSPHQMESID